MKSEQTGDRALVLKGAGPCPVGQTLLLCQRRGRASTVYERPKRRWRVSVTGHVTVTLDSLTDRKLVLGERSVCTSRVPPAMGGCRQSPVGRVHSADSAPLPPAGTRRARQRGGQAWDKDVNGGCPGPRPFRLREVSGKLHMVSACPMPCKPGGWLADSWNPLGRAATVTKQSPPPSAPVGPH